MLSTCHTGVCSLVLMEFLRAEAKMNLETEAGGEKRLLLMMQCSGSARIFGF